MRISDLLWMAIKSLKIRRMVFPAAVIAISAFCLCFAGAVLVTVQQEKSLPYELEVTPDTAEITDSTLAEVSGIPDVKAVTPVLEVPVSVTAGGGKAQLTLTGIDAAYLNEAFAQGGIFPDSSVMPYIVLNKAACKLFQDDNGGDESAAETDMPQIDWLNVAVSVQTSEAVEPVVSKIAGILSGDEEDQEPAAYISAACAKALLRQDGQSTDYMSADVRVESVGSAAAVSEQITALGLGVLNANEDDQAKWDRESGEMTYLIVIAVFGLICWAFFAAARKKAYVLEHKETFSALQWLGMKKNNIGRLLLLQSLMSVLLGISVGIIVGVSVPSFLSPELLDTSIFALQIPLGVAAVSAAICIAFGFLFLRVKNVKGI